MTTTKPIISHRQLVATINLLEPRLQEYEVNLNSEPELSDVDKQIFPDRTAALYYYMLGKAYADLHKITENKASAPLQEFKDRSVAALEKSVATGSTCLDITDSMYMSMLSRSISVSMLFIIETSMVICLFPPLPCQTCATNSTTTSTTTTTYVM